MKVKRKHFISDLDKETLLVLLQRPDAKIYERYPDDRWYGAATKEYYDILSNATWPWGEHQRAMFAVETDLGADLEVEEWIRLNSRLKGDE